MDRYPTHKALHEALILAAQASKRLVDDAHGGEHAAATLAAMVPAPAPAPGVVVGSPLHEVKR